MNTPQSASPALVLIDFQLGFDDVTYWGDERNNPEAEANAARLLAHWREHQLPIFHVQHCSSQHAANPDLHLAPGQPGHAFKPEATPLPGEPVIQKNVNSAFIGTNLQQQLEGQHITTLVIAGLTTDHCVSTTTRMAGNLGFRTFLVADACATFNKSGINGEAFSAELIHQTALASLNKEFATVITTEAAIQQVAASALVV